MENTKLVLSQSPMDYYEQERWPRLPKCFKPFCLFRLNNSPINQLCLQSFC